MKIKCPVCNNEFSQLSIQHIRKHGIKTFADFRSLYPGVPYISDEVRKAAGDITNKDVNKYKLHIENLNAKYLILYLANPKLCLYCKNIIPYAKRLNNCCNRTCNALYRTKPKKEKVVKEKIIYKCVSCERVLANKTKTLLCSVCYQQTDIAEKNRGKTFSKTRKIIDTKYGQWFVLSSYEERFIRICEANDILLCKPEPIEYKKPSGTKHQYFPDFYLPEYNVIVEIKGYLTKEDKIKMSLVQEQNKHIKILMTYQSDLKQLETLTL